MRYEKNVERDSLIPVIWVKDLEEQNQTGLFLLWVLQYEDGSYLSQYSRLSNGKWKDSQFIFSDSKRKTETFEVNDFKLTSKKRDGYKYDFYYTLFINGNEYVYSYFNKE